MMQILLISCINSFDSYSAPESSNCFHRTTGYGPATNAHAIVTWSISKNYRVHGSISLNSLTFSSPSEMRQMGCI